MRWHTSVEAPLAYCACMRNILTALLIAVALAACGSYNGGSGGSAPTAAPQATGAAQTPMPSGNPDVDNYGY